MFNGRCILWLILFYLLSLVARIYCQNPEVNIDAQKLKQNAEIKSNYFNEEKFTLTEQNNKDLFKIDIGTIQSQEGIEVFSLDLSKYNIIFDSLTTFSWKWMIKDTDFSEGIFLQIELENKYRLSITSHTNRTFPNTLDCMEQSSVWAEHKINLWQLLSDAGKSSGFSNTRIKKMTLLTLDSYNQKVYFEYLKFSREPLKNADNTKDFRFVKQNHTEHFRKKPVSVAIADIDRDGDRDLYLVNQAGSNYALLNHGYARFDKTIFLYDSLRWSKNSHANFFDINHDGWPDLFEGREHNSNQLFINQGNTRFKADQRYQRIGHPHLQTYASLAGDFDQDQKLDFVEIAATLPSMHNAGLLLILNQNKGSSFSRRLLGQRFAPFGGCSADFNEDGHPDFFTASNTDKNDLYYLDDSLNPKFFPKAIFDDPFDPASEDFFGYNPSEGAVFWDFDIDGDLDIYVCNDGQPNQLFRQDQGCFTECARQYGLADSLASEGFLVADFDNDMDWDVYLLHTYQQNTLLLNDSKGYFYDGTDGSGFEFFGGSVGAACADLDNDGDVDIVQVDPRHGHRVMLNPLNKRNFFKLKMRGAPGNYEGLRSKVYLYETHPADSVLRLYHQTTCGDGFQYEAFARDFQFGLMPDRTYALKVIFADGKMYETQIDKSATTILALYPDEFFLKRFVNRILYQVHEPVLVWLRAHGLWLTLLLIMTVSLLVNFSRMLLFRNLRNRIITGIAALVLLYLFLQDLKIVPSIIIALILVPGVFFSELVLDVLRRFLRNHYVREKSWDRLFDHLQAFRHGGMALRNTDRLIFLFQNISAFEGDRGQYKKHIDDAIQTFINQTSWQITELVYILKNLHWNRMTISNILRGKKQLIKTFEKMPDAGIFLSNQKQSSTVIVRRLERLQGQVEQIYNQIRPRFTCYPEQIIHDVVRTRFTQASVDVMANSLTKVQVLMKGFELGNIIADLIDNGMRACKRQNTYRGSIVLSADENHVNIDVTDNGSGITKADQNKIFEKGFSKREQGGGFGLYYGLEMAKRYGGDLFVFKSRRNSGTTMRLKLKKIKTEM